VRRETLNEGNLKGFYILEVESAVAIGKGIKYEPVDGRKAKPLFKDKIQVLQDVLRKIGIKVVIIQDLVTLHLS